MKELKCPKCGSVFTVDEADYASILSQVKNEEFDRQVARRLAEIKEAEAIRAESLRLKDRNDHDRQMAAKDTAIAKLNTEIERLKGRLEALDSQKEMDFARRQAQTEKINTAVLTEKNNEIARLTAEIKSNDTRTELAISRQRQDYELQLREKDEQIKYYAEMKQRLSTKMIGESLEQHCMHVFNAMRAWAFPNAYFEKDNDTSSGSKGDFIFRDYDGEDEYISIMFEMKNEMDTTATKHRNEDFFEKLDRDRRAKNCEFAVLVSLLERDSELYNEGIVDVSYRYDKMYVIRPQFFMSTISMLARASRKSIQLKRELQIAQNQSIDVSDFEIKLNRYKTEFDGYMGKAHDKYTAAIEKIDRTIKSLQDIRKLFEDSEKYLLRAGDKLNDDITIRKLTYRNPTMRQKFEEARRTAADALQSSDSASESE